MSESDSDLNYESADEDSEFVSHLNIDTSSEIGNKNDNKENLNVTSTFQESIIPDLDSNVKNPPCDDEKQSFKPHKSEKEENSSSISYVEEPRTLPAQSKKEAISSQEPSKEETSTDVHNVSEKLDESVSKHSSVLEDNRQNSDGESVSKKQPPTKQPRKMPRKLSQKVSTVEEAAVKMEVSNNEDKEANPIPEAHSSKPAPENRRIPLRLEKKKQQSLKTKDISPVRETKSDLVNILQESNKEKFSSWGFSSWGTSLLSTAASSVSSFSTQVSQGIGTVLDTVESTLGAPSPEELASILKQKKEKFEDNSEIETTESQVEANTSLLSDVSLWTSKLLENTGSKVLMGGLDTLEMIGKKSIDILTVGDPGLRKKRSAFGTDGVNLSEILREAKTRAADLDAADGGGGSSGAAHYSQVFDDCQGLVHLEALEMLSRQSQAKVQRLLLRHARSEEVRGRLADVKAICENVPALDDPAVTDSFDDFESVFKKHALELSLPLNLESIVKSQKQISDSLKKYECADGVFSPSQEIYQLAISSLAEFTAKCIEAFHKVAELLLVQSSLDSDLENCATNLTGLTTVMCIETNNLSLRYHKCLDSTLENMQEKSNMQDITTMVTNLYVEAGNSNKYIQDAYQMLIPVLQECLLANLE